MVRSTSRIAAILLIATAVGVAWYARDLGANDSVHAADLNPWTKFGIGSWKKVRVFSESLNESGKVESTSIRETKTTLLEVTDTHFTLKVETSVEVAGKTFMADPSYVKQGYNGETNGQTVEIKKIGPGEIVIDGRKYPSEIRQVVVNGDELRRVSVVHFNDLIPPHVLRRETTATDAAGTQKNYETLVEVVAVDMPYRVLTESKTVFHVKTTHRQASGKSIVVMEAHCPDVPGSVVAHSSKELNVAGRIVSRETLELTEYHAVSIADEPQSVTTTNRRRIFSRNTRTRSGG
jgi:hypothetical protein